MMVKIFGVFILSMVLVAPVQSAVIDYEVQIQAKDLTEIPWVMGSIMWGGIESGNATATNSVGFNSLIGLDIGLFRFDFGDLELTSWRSPGATTPGWQLSTEGDSSVQPIRFYYGGTEWASGSLNFLKTEVMNSNDVNATGFGTLNLESGTAEGMDFYTEVMTLSSGTGLMSFTVDKFISIDEFVSVNEPGLGLFYSTGTLSVSPVPNPPTLALFVLGLAILFGVRRRIYSE